MLIAAIVALGCAVLVGAVLAVFYLQTETGATAPWPLAALHGLLGAGGLACLLFGLQGPPRGLDQGTGSFGSISAALVALAALVGVIVLVTHLRRRRRAGTLIGTHATLAVAGFVVLLAYLLA